MIIYVCNPKQKSVRTAPRSFSPLGLGHIGRDEHGGEVLELVGSADLFGEEREAHDVEHVGVELVCFGEVLLLHFVPDEAVVAV